MKLLVDAQLPKTLADALSSLGHDAVHTSQLPKGNRTPDSEILRLSLGEKRIVVTKDAEFADSFVLHKEPYKLLVVATGNMGNSKLRELFSKNIEALANAFGDASFIELSKSGIVVHE